MRLLRCTLTCIEGIWKADRALSRAYPYRKIRDVVLDTLLGPADSEEYVSRTAPAGPPPTIS